MRRSRATFADADARREPIELLDGREIEIAVLSAGFGMGGPYLERGDRIIMPKPAVKALAFVGAHAPRALWLRLCQRTMGS